MIEHAVGWLAPRRVSMTAALLSAALVGNPALGYDIVNRWTTTKTDGGGIQRGDAITLTWSYVPDGDSYSRLGDGSTELIDFLDDAWNVSTPDRGFDFTNRPWWDLTNRAYEQYQRVSGLTLTHVLERDASGTRTGLSGDLRIGGGPIDGLGGTLADNTFPNSGDMRIDTSRQTDGTPDGFYNPTNPQGYINLIAHESGHGVGLGHSERISGADSVMEGGIQSHFFGLQFDDVYAFNRNYGDPLEKNGGNDSFANATDLGSLAIGTNLARGTDANDSAVTEFDDDWLGIDGNSDIDYFKFTLNQRSTIDLTLSPQGPTYTTQEQGANTDFSARADLNLQLYSGSAALIRTVDDGNAGQPEAITDIQLDAGDYFIRVDGEQDLNQFYRLDLSAAQVPSQFQLVYRPGTGKLLIDTGDRVIRNYVIQGTGFIEERHTAIFNSILTSLDDQLSESEIGPNPPSGLLSLGQVLPTGLDAAGFEALISATSYVEDFGQPINAFDLVVDGRYALTYDAATGELVLDTLGGSLKNYVLISEGGFIEENHVAFMGELGSSVDFQLSETGIGFSGSGAFNLGAVLPTQMTPAEFEAFFTSLTYVSDFGAPIETFDLGFVHLAGDTDLDVDIDDTDIGVMIANFTGPAGAGKGVPTGDADGDGDVDDTDLGLAIAGFTGPRSAPVPEPAGAALVALGTLTVWRRRRR